MPGAGGFVSATLHMDDVVDGLDAMERRAHALGGAFKAVKTAMKADQKDHARRKAGPFGPWARRAPSTLEKLRRDGRRAPRPLGKLLNSARYKSDATHASAESPVKWSGAQQDGDTVGRGAKLPARPFLWLSRKLLDQSEEIIGDSVVGAFGGR